MLLLGLTVVVTFCLTSNRPAPPIVLLFKMSGACRENNHFVVAAPFTLRVIWSARATSPDDLANVTHTAAHQQLAATLRTTAVSTRCIYIYTASLAILLVKS